MRNKRGPFFFCPVVRPEFGEQRRFNDREYVTTIRQWRTPRKHASKKKPNEMDVLSLSKDAQGADKSFEKT